jgi:dTDP-4-amino-4,6-dideoxygalactose transaminase
MDKEIFVTRSSMPSYEEYCEAIKPLWESRWLTNMGEYHQAFEDKLKEYLDVPEVSLTVNGHMALELAIQSFGFPEGSEVITTPFTFISTTHAIVRNRLEPVFCDVKESDGTLDETKIEALITPKTVAILPVHVYGHICNVDVIQQIADKYGLKVIYDAAHAFGEKHIGVGVANFGDASIFSFHATKVFNTIEGGAVCAKNHEVYEKLYNLKNFGIRGEELVVSVGANAKMNEFCAIMGLCNLQHLPDAIADRKRVYNLYKEKLTGVEGINFFEENADTEKNYAYFPILVEEIYPVNRDELYNRLVENGIHARKYFYPITADQACFKNKYISNRLDIARLLAHKVLMLPIYEGLEDRYIEVITDCIKMDNK